jgi:uncharacterized phiE125 gp8 family phage protein
MSYNFGCLGGGYSSYSGSYGFHTPAGSSQNLTETSPPQSFVEPLTLAEMKSYLKVPERSPVDDEEEAGILSLISAAREQAEILQGRDLVEKQFDQTYDYWPAYAIELRAPLKSVDLFQYRDYTGLVTTLAPDDNYIVDRAKSPGLIMPVYNTQWPNFTPWPSSAILIRFTCGLSLTDAWWADAGMRVRNGMRLLIADWWNNRLPFEKGRLAADAYPFGVMACLSYGSLLRVR